jgi:hypothetical protein
LNSSSSILARARSACEARSFTATIATFAW